MLKPSVSVITPRSGHLNLHELWFARGLLWALIRRQISVQYKQTFLGIGWVLLQPLVMVAVFSLAFGRVVHDDAEVPYVVFALSGLLIWQFMARGITGGTNSLLSQNVLVTKVYFPRPLIVLSYTVGPLIDFAVTFLLWVAVSLFLGVIPSLTSALALVFLLFGWLIVTGVALILAPLNALYRDLQAIVPFAMQAALFLTPVLYPPSFLPDGLAWVLDLNPLSGVVQGFRWSLLPHEAPPGLLALASMILAALVLPIGGLWAFRQLESLLVDRI